MRLGQAAFAFAAIGTAIVVAAFAVPQAEPSLITIPNLVAQHAAFDGKTVRVRGFLSQCADENCALTSAPYDGRNLRAWHDRGGRLLSIGADPAFDQQTAGFANRAVVIRARFRDDCLRPQTLCSDRAPTLQPLGRHSLIPDEEI